jgi:excisionase family DNA binding protein
MEPTILHGPHRHLLTAEEAAQVLGIGRTTVFHLLKTGQLESVRIGRHRRIPLDALQKLLDTLRTAEADT